MLTGALIVIMVGALYIAVRQMRMPQSVVSEGIEGRGLFDDSPDNPPRAANTRYAEAHAARLALEIAAYVPGIGWGTKGVTGLRAIYHDDAAGDLSTTLGRELGAALGFLAPRIL